MTKRIETTSRGSSLFWCATLCALVTIAVECLGQREARADGSGYEECKQILVAGVFNKFSSKSSGLTTMSAATKEEAFFSSESESFQQYEKDYSEARSNNLKIDVE